MICQGKGNELNDLEHILINIKSYFNLSKDKEIADLLGVKQQTLTNWKLRNKIPYKEIVSLCLDKKITLFELFTQEENEKRNKMIGNFKESYENEIKEEQENMINELSEELKKINNTQFEYMYHKIKSDILRFKMQNKENTRLDNQLDLIIANVILKN
jgi:hypothetical protein